MFKVLLALFIVVVMTGLVTGECDPYTRCFGHGDYNAATKTCSCYTYWTVNRHWGPYSGECCESIGCKANATCKHGVCGTDGITCQHCQTGWSGTNCDNVTACFPWFSCGPHGRCSKSRFRCECDPGWHGDLCDRTICTVPCVFGLCRTDPKKCECQDHYRSPETGCDRAFCATGWECLNGGYCIDSRHCKCPPYFTGLHCEHIANCSVPCFHGRCTKTPDHCECETNWEGADCNKYIGPCNNCSTVGGTCFDGPDTCTCKPGYTGPQCSVQKCDGCSHGYCQLSGGKKSCTCDYGWLNTVGPASEFNPGRGPCTKIWKCITPCVYGSCPNDPFKCVCRAPYTGSQCDVIKCPDCCPPETCDCSSGHFKCRPDWHHDCCLVKSCFRGDTLVHTDRGLVPIKDVKVGDMVVTRHEGDLPDVTYMRRVDQVRKQHVSPKDLVVFQSGGENIWVTHNHPFFVEGTKKWVSAVDVTTSHALQSVKGKPVSLQQNIPALQLMASNGDEKIPVYDLSVREYDRYAVGREGLLASGCNTTDTLLARDHQVWGALARPRFASELAVGANEMKKKTQEKPAHGGSNDKSSSSSGLYALAAIVGVCLIAVVAVMIRTYYRRHQYSGLKDDYVVTESSPRS